MAKTETAALPQTGPRRGLDPEIQALAKIDRILSDLDTESLPRVLGWIMGRHGSRFGKVTVQVTELGPDRSRLTIAADAEIDPGDPRR